MRQFLRSVIHMKPIVVSDILAVGEFPTSEQFDILAKAGFKSVLNNQPDGEVDRFPGSQHVALEAKRCGLAHAYAPIASRTPTSDELDAYADALAALPAPIYAFCYSGERSAAACAFKLAGEKEPKAVIAEFAEAGFDFARLEPWLADEHQRHRGVKDSGANAQDGGNGGTPASMGSVPPHAPAIAPMAVKQAVQGIVVHARARGYSSYAM